MRPAGARAEGTIGPIRAEVSALESVALVGGRAKNDGSAGIIDGFEVALRAFAGLFDGGNRGNRGKRLGRV